MTEERKEYLQITAAPAQAGFSSVSVPPSKSLSHRALITAALSEQTSRLCGLADNADIQATIRALRILGCDVRQDGDIWLVRGGMHADEVTIDCGESASTLRFLLPLAVCCAHTVHFTGHGRLMERPLDAYRTIFEQQGLLFRQEGNVLTVRGPLQAGDFTVDAGISSQFASGLLFALPFLEGDSRIRFARAASRPYIRMTEYMLKQAGIRIDRTAYGFDVPGFQTASPLAYTCEKDMTAAAVFAVCAVIGKQALEVQGMTRSVLQGDRVITDILQRMGARFEETPAGTVWHPSQLHGTVIDLLDCPDLGPVLFAAAAKAEGKTVFRNAGRLREKESDRIECMRRELEKFGVRMSVDANDTVTVYGGSSAAGSCEADGHGDHRVVMALAVLAAASEHPVTIRGCEAVRKSWPDFFEELKHAGVLVTGISK